MLRACGRMPAPRAVMRSPASSIRARSLSRQMRWRRATPTADAVVGGVGIDQFVIASQTTGAEVELRADAIVINSGLIDVGGTALAEGAEGSAAAYFAGIYQTAAAGLGTTATGGAVAFASVDNVGDILVHAKASALMDDGYANASAGASAIIQDAGAVAEATGASAIVQVINDGSIVANATAVGVRIWLRAGRSRGLRYLPGCRGGIVLHRCCPNRCCQRGCPQWLSHQRCC